ncbi:MAG TPA: NAD(P)H-hydrate dehydratase [Granulicella sp.]
MKILTTAEMGAADRRTAEEFHVPLTSLMERAGGAVATFCLQHYASASHITALCGKGNNGGDGFVAARHLAQAGRTVRVLLLGYAADLKGEAAAAFAQLGSIPVIEIDAEATLRKELEQTDLLLDAVVGTGFHPPLRGLAATVGELLDHTDYPIVSVDLPSGWDADSTAQSSEEAYRSDAVVTFTAPKLAHIFGHLTRHTFGPVVVAPIGSPDEAIQSATGLLWGGSAKSIAEAPRDVNANKGRFGHILIVGGSYGKPGAPSMASLAALRAGAGLVTAAVPDSILNVVALVTPELMTTPLKEVDGAVALANLEPVSLDRLLKSIKVIALGPGLSTDGEASVFARELLAKTTLPIVLDADALNAFAGHVDLLDGSKRPIVLTPHPGEMARLLGVSIPEVEADRINIARNFATKHRLTLVLKGWRTLIAHPDGSIGVNTSGNPAMSKGGSGDILTGIVAAMLGQFPNDVARAVETAVYLHGLAADFAAQRMDEHTVLATDTVAHLSDAFRYRVTDASGFTWITGVHA